MTGHPVGNIFMLTPFQVGLIGVAWKMQNFGPKIGSGSRPEVRLSQKLLIKASDVIPIFFGLDGQDSMGS